VLQQGMGVAHRLLHFYWENGNQEDFLSQMAAKISVENLNLTADKDHYFEWN